MSGWIKLWKDMPSDPRVLAAALKLSQRYVLAERTPGGGNDLSSNALCNAWRNAVIGALATLWCYADEHIRDDDTLPLTSQTLDAVVGLEGFFDVMPREWIDELDDGSIALPGYCEKNSLIAKRKRTVKSNARVTRWRRENKVKGNGVTDTHATHHNVAGDLDQDLYKDQDQEKKKTRAARGADEPEGDDLEFQALRALYPQRSGDQRWHDARQAINARLREGHTWEQILDGTRRYADWCKTTGKIGTETVKQAATFVGPGKPFLDDWTPPVTKADVRLAGNLSAADEFMRRTEVRQ